MWKEAQGLIEAIGTSTLSLAFAFVVGGLWIYRRITDKGKADIPRETRQAAQKWGGRLIAFGLGLGAGHFGLRVIKEVLGCLAQK